MDAFARNSQFFQGDVFCFVCVHFPLGLLKAIRSNAGCFVVNEDCADACTSKLLPDHLCPMCHTSQISRSLGLVYVASGSFGAVVVNLLSAILRPGSMHLHETDRSPTVMCLTNGLFVSKWAF